MLDDRIALVGIKPDTHWRVTLKVIGPFDNDVVLHCYKLKYIKDKGIVVSGYSTPFYKEYDGEDIFVPIDDIYTVETVVDSEYGTKTEKLCFDSTWKDEEARMFDRMRRRVWHDDVF